MNQQQLIPERVIARLEAENARLRQQVEQLRQQRDQAALRAGAAEKRERDMRRALDRIREKMREARALG